MNDLEKKSFYSFLGLYIISSLLFILLVGYWYYVAQKNALENETYYKMEHIADLQAGEIIMSHMQNRALHKVTIPQDVILALIDTDSNVAEGTLLDPDMEMKPGYFKKNGYRILVSDAPKEHRGIKYVVVQSGMHGEQIEALRTVIWQMILAVLFLMVCVAWILSRLFMRPLRQRVAQIERFINDITHELNTPVSSLSMATEQALTKGECSERTLKNIAISTRQLYDIYRSLTYLNFNRRDETEDEMIDLAETLKESIAYYRPLAEVKQIRFDTEVEETKCNLPHTQAVLLFGNLIGNAIKYSHRNSTVWIHLKDRVLHIRDRGIGIDPNRQTEIFEKFRRGTEYSGGFGVGLNIVKSICDSYRIRIELESVPDEGTEFRLYFP